MGPVVKIRGQYTCLLVVAIKPGLLGAGLQWQCSEASIRGTVYLINSEQLVACHPALETGSQFS